MERNIYLEDVPLAQAQTLFAEALRAAGCWQPLPPETIPTAAAFDRVTAAPVYARISAPHYHASAMDGYAVHARDTVGATETSAVSLRLVAPDEKPPFPSAPAQPVNTGQPLPRWANAVVMIEHTQPATLPDGAPAIAIRAALPPWHHVRPMGEDMVATELVLPSHHRLRPVDLGALLGAGHATVSVFRRPRVAIIPTGSELVTLDPDQPLPALRPGQIVEYNSTVLAAQVKSWGGVPQRWPVVDDEPAAIRQAVRDAASEHDLILVNAGSSAGSEDYTAHIINELGQLLVHGVAVRPGHPVILGLIAAGASGRQVPVIGVPGYPVSAALTGEIFVEPLLARWQGQTSRQQPTLQGRLTRKVNSHTGDDDFVRVAVGQVDNSFIVTPISSGAGVISSLVRADGILRVPRFSEGHDAGETVTVHLYRAPAELAHTIVAIGSHDLVLDLLAQHLAAGPDHLRLVSANVGSLGGLVALRRAEAHFAGCHLLDPETGTYNDSYIRRYLPETELAVVTLAGREQGWIVKPGNPLDLRDWTDVVTREARLVNRQRGAGTRVLLDYEFAERGIDPSQIPGYERDEYTHLAVAAAVASGVADAGLGIRAAARALELDFVPLAHEQYELVIPRRHYESELLRPLLQLLADDAFRHAVDAMPGYDATPMGRVRFLNGS